MKVLNIASGKFEPMYDLINSENESLYELNIDTSYYSNSKTEDIEQELFNSKESPSVYKKQYFLNEDVFQFMERTILTFDHVAMYRFLEHVSFTQVLYFIYLISTITKSKSLVDIIVPNYKKLAEMLLNEDDIVESSKFEAHNTLLTTELLNEISSPHASIWTPKRASHFWELENRFSIKTINENCRFDGRDIYMRIIAERV